MGVVMMAWLILYVAFLASAQRQRHEKLLVVAKRNKDSIPQVIRKKSADLAYSDQELRETGVQNLKAYKG